MFGDKPLLLSPDKERPPREARADRPKRDGKRRERSLPDLDTDKLRYRIEVGHEHGVKPGNIVGAIANEAGSAGEHIGHISIQDDYSLVDLPSGMPMDVLSDLKKVRVCGRPLNISVNALERKLRLGSPPVIARIKENVLLIDARTVQDKEVKILLNCVIAAFNK